MSDSEDWRERRREGSEFEAKVIAGWMIEPDAERRIREQAGVKKPNGRRGRIDLFWDIEDSDDPYFRAVIEMKHTNWDRMRDLAAVRRNVLRHKNQIWNYVNALAIVPAEDDPSGKSVEEIADMKLVAIEQADQDRAPLISDSYTILPCVTYSRMPKDSARLQLIESLFDEHLIAVDWFDETVEERILRHERDKEASAS
jgi:hypothetical protein